MSDIQQPEELKTPTIWHSFGVGIAVAILTVIILGVINFPDDPFGEWLIRNIFSQDILFLFIPSLVGAFIGLRWKTFMALWIGAITTTLILLGIVAFIYQKNGHLIL